MGGGQQDASTVKAAALSIRRKLNTLTSSPTGSTDGFSTPPAKGSGGWRVTPSPRGMNHISLFNSGGRR